MKHREYLVPIRIRPLFSCVLAALSASLLLAGDGPLDARKWQLFFDNTAIARATGFERVVHHPRSRGVVIDNDKPWESDAVAPLNVIRKPDGTFVAYYVAIFWAPGTTARSSPLSDMVYANGAWKRRSGADMVYIDGTWKPRAADTRPPDVAQQYVTSRAYATSSDGIHWDKPNLGLVEAPTGIDWKKYPGLPSPTGASKANNLGVPFLFVDLGRSGNVKDPAKRYAVVLDGRLYFTPEIPDFIHDPGWRSKLVDSGGRPSPRGASLSFWDEANGEWVGIAQNAVPHWIPSREIARFASSDLKNWRSDIVLAPDPEDSTNPTRYDEPMSLDPFYSEGILFGLLSWIHTDRTTPDGGLVLDRNSPMVQNWQQGWPTPATAQNPFVWPFARKGTNEMRITLSHDGGKTWDRTSSRVAWIPHGTEEDSFDRMILSTCPPVRVNDEDWFYLGVWNGDHLSTRADAEQRPYYHDRMRQGRIALYTQKHNRYVSLRTRTQRETLITRPFKVDGDTLQLNVDASRGRVRVAIAEYKPVSSLTRNSSPSDATTGAMSLAPHLLMEQNSLPGFGFDDCQPVLANNTEFTVQFRNGASLAAIRGKTVVLCVEMLDSDLYGFRLR
jgi:hypothetical protein